MLEILNQEYFQKVTLFAQKTGQAEKLFKVLLYLHTWGDKEASGDRVVELGKDFAPASFFLNFRGKKGSFLANGGLIYHGDQRGWVQDSGKIIGEDAAPQDPLSVTLASSPEHPWSVHT